MIEKQISILVFPCGSEVGLEVHKSLKDVRYITLFGANSVDDHGMFEYKNYIGNLPFINDKNFLESLKKIVDKYSIDAIYPAMDLAAYELKKNEDKLGCKVITSDLTVNEIALHKQKTYQTLKEVINTPVLFENPTDIQQNDFPVFIKPNIGYGSKGTYLAKNKEDLIYHLKNNSESEKLILEYLPGEEYTLDCLSDQDGKLLFVNGRRRNRIKNGTSVNTFSVENSEFYEIAEKISKVLKLKYSWFVQLKKDKRGTLTLLEISTRLGGSSSINRVRGVNFALLSILSALDYPIEINYNNFDVILDRSLKNSYKTKIEFDNVYIDLDDCLIMNKQINTTLICFIFQCINDGKNIYLLTRHNGDLPTILSTFRLTHLFDEVIHLKDNQKKSFFIKPNSIFIDDSYAERQEVNTSKHIFTFSPDAVEVLLN
ncbi:hypothetical protein Q75_13495 [Bacillus coahuilensis p1.1.43]|uniref:ATP-grasp domain-containing protein n=1 Tax=Bacillus coahuilensis p1.1.43 TaxID=1150625 RepID=A0A147K606_9BACI|nr:ATP-grasp domain-containing protein [Bacillus coahuilensis]KUP05259.1 hypothetical protein Q75_13495 [Bacillus coahuilensis p1.1.43]